MGKVVEIKKQKETKEQKFSISYDAAESDFKEHEINARDLGQAILGMHNLIEETAAILSGGAADVELKVYAPLKEGSVIIDFVLQADPVAVVQVLKYLGFSTVGGAIVGGPLVEFIKHIRNKKIISVVVEKKTGIATVTTDSGVVKCDEKVAMLAVSKKVRESLHKVIQAPLSGKPGAVFKVLDAKDKQVWAADEDEVDDYTPLPQGSLEEVAVEKEKINVSFSQVNFNSSRGWRIRLSDGDEHSVVMDDNVFLNKVRESVESFRKDDLYEIVLSTTTTKRPTRSTVDRVVVEVTRHWAHADRRQV